MGPLRLKAGVAGHEFFHRRDTRSCAVPSIVPPGIAPRKRREVGNICSQSSERPTRDVRTRMPPGAGRGSIGAAEVDIAPAYGTAVGTRLARRRADPGIRRDSTSSCRGQYSTPMAHLCGSVVLYVALCCTRSRAERGRPPRAFVGRVAGRVGGGAAGQNGESAGTEAGVPDGASVCL